MKRSAPFAPSVRYLVVVLAVSLIGASIGVRGQQVRLSATVAGELLVRYRPGAQGNGRARARGNAGAALISRFDALDIDHLRVPEGRELDALAALRADADVLIAEPNYVRTAVASGPPNDPYWLAGNLWGLLKIMAQPAWTNFPTGGQSVVVADIDTGVNYAHPDLAASMWRNPGEIPGNGIDDDGNGYVDDVYGIDTFNRDSDPMDDNGHGTHTAGTIAAAGNNGIGVVGTAFNAKILSCKFLDASGNGSDSSAIACFNYVALMKGRGVNIRVTSNSWGGTRSGPEPTLLKNAIDALGSAGIVNMFAAGNSGLNNDMTPFDPASLSSSSVVSIAASDGNDARTGFSNYGAISVDLAAPGDSILSTYGAGYGYLSGTSMATPHVAGAAAFLFGMNPSLTVANVKALLMNNVDHMAQWNGVVASGGRLNLFNSALAAFNNTPPSVTITSPTDQASATVGSPVAVTASATDADGSVAQVAFYVDGSLLTTDTTAPYSVAWTGSVAGAHTLQAVATDNLGTTAASGIVHVTLTAAAVGGLPSGWSNQDIGAVGASGSAAAANGVFTVTGSGADIWGTADAFQFAYQTWTGDGQITARVATLQNTNVWAMAGVMWRESLTAGARHSSLLVSPVSGLSFEQRSATGGVSTYVGGTGAPPLWLRLVRAGSVLTASTSPDGSTWTVVGTQTLALSSTLYVGLAVTSHVQGVLATAAFDNVSATPLSGALPSGWSNQDIGNVGAAGGATATNGVFTLTGSGADIWGTADAFQFAYQAWVGDGQITARVASLQNTNAWAMAGVMWRESLAPGARHSSLLVSPVSGLSFEQRPTTNGISTYSGGTGAPPLWVRLVRSGSTLTASTSPDGAAWTVVGTQTLALSSTIYVGLAVTSHVQGVPGTATFDNVSVGSSSAALPSGWNNQDIGNVGAAGGAVATNGLFTVTGSGADIWGTADAFQLAYQPWSGDGQIIARVASLQNTNAWAMAGVMWRESLAPGARHSSLLVSSVSGLSFEQRPTTNGISTYTGGVGAAPLWVRLARAGSTFTAATSADGTTWTVVGTQTLALPSTIYVGLAVTSHAQGVLGTATFDNVSVGP